MTTIVRHKRTGNEYILLGINGEINKVNPSRFINDLFNQEKSEVACSATVCDFRGNIFLVYIDDLIVIEIDGKKPTDILPEPPLKSVSNDVYQQPENDFAEDELEDEDEDFDNDQDLATESSTSEQDISRPSNQKNFDNDEDEDWI
ncbi:MAG: hypothetical protein ACRC2S_08685 [Waterburya sp.]